MESNDLGILHIDMKEEAIPVYEFTKIIGIINDLYSSYVWLSLAEKNKPGEFFPHEYSLTKDESLYINKIAIGTPNEVEFIGLAEQLINVVQFLGSAAGISAFVKYGFGIVKDSQDVILKSYQIKELKEKLKKAQEEEEKAKKEAEEQIKEKPKPRKKTPRKPKINEEKVDLQSSANRLASQYKITDESLRHKRAIHKEYAETMKVLAPIYVTSATFTIIEQSSNNHNHS